MEGRILLLLVLVLNMSVVAAIQPTKAHRKAMQFLEEYAARPGTVQLPSGLQYTVRAIL